MEKASDLEERTDSESSSGCQSGWTLYLGRSASLQLRTGGEEDDLSMLSDASSGPPRRCFCYSKREGCQCDDSFLTLTEVAKYGDERRSLEEEKEMEMSLNLEDTASSPLFSCYKATNTISCSRKELDGALEQSRSLSESHFKEQFSYLHSLCTCESTTGLQRR